MRVQLTGLRSHIRQPGSIPARCLCDVYRCTAAENAAGQRHAESGTELACTGSYSTGKPRLRSRQPVDGGVGDGGIREPESDTEEQVSGQQHRNRRVVVERDQAQSTERRETTGDQQRPPRAEASDEYSGQRRTDRCRNGHREGDRAARAGLIPRECCK